MEDFFTGFAPKSFQLNPQSPAINIKEVENGYEMELSVPGFSKNEIEAVIDENTLTVKASKERASDATTEQFKRREFVIAGFERNFELPDTVDQQKINVSYSNGLLEIQLPLKKESKSKLKRTLSIS
jgi:HSP20 family protein